MLTTAFLGVAHIHTPDFINRLNKREDVQVKAVYDHEAERGQKRAEASHATFTPDIDSILNDPEITSVVICSETNRHGDLVERVAAAGKHMFVEKPLAVTGSEAQRMADAITRAGVTFQTGFASRSTPQMQFIKREVAAGHLGTITRMRHCNGHSGSLGGWFDTEWRWIADAEQAGGGGFADLGAHSLDIILWVLRGVCGEVKRVAGSVGHATNRYGDIDEYGAGLITFDSGAIAEVEASWVDPKLHSPVEVFGTQGQIQVIGGKVFYYSEHVEGADGGEWTDLPAQQSHAFELFFDKLGGKPIGVDLVTVEQAAEESRVMHEMYLAAGA
ncbi:MAG: Gfo/Idh/MocA family oxidoreductase [Abitibacteriaceae bacterium]|nr:Gfo/Idh/MocA family oxidoreductase [Abditibacteriaceae bacterium]MBV9868389.1 Gfo/Idh/MocA family oxidoreductase [Abditibacteriaceae bacterium]